MHSFTVLYYKFEIVSQHLFILAMFKSVILLKTDLPLDLPIILIVSLVYCDIALLITTVLESINKCYHVNQCKLPKKERWTKKDKTNHDI